jgi:hypothetical protein
MNKTYVGALLEFEKRCNEEIPGIPDDAAWARWRDDVCKRIAILQNDSREFFDHYAVIPEVTSNSWQGFTGWKWSIVVPSDKRREARWVRDHRGGEAYVNFDREREAYFRLEVALHLAAALNMGIQALADLPD